MEEAVHQNSIDLPKDYFSKSVKTDYKDWHSAFVREFLQNSHDAGSKNIGLFANGSNFSISDDGCGMDRNTLEKVLLVLHGTDKGDDSAGGFGRAKELIYFAWPEWSIRTRNLLVEGNFIDYSISEVSEFYNGTKSLVTLDENSEAKLFEVFQAYINKCSLSANITWNDKSFEGMGSLDKLELLDKGRLYAIFKMPVKSTELYVRSNGLFMFSRPFRTDMGLICEIPKGMSKEVLTTNRDGFRYPHDELFEAVIGIYQEGGLKGMKAALDPDELKKSKKRSLGVKSDFNIFRDMYNMMCPLYIGPVNFELKDISDIFYDNNLEGKNVLIRLNESIFIKEKNEKKIYSCFVGKNAGLSDDAIIFEAIQMLTQDIVLEHEEDISDIFDLCDTSFRADAAELLGAPENPKKFLFKKPYTGNLVITGLD